MSTPDTRRDPKPSGPTMPCLNVVVSCKRAEEMSWLLFDLGAQAVEQRDSTTMTTADNGLTLLVAGFADAADRDRAADALAQTAVDMVEAQKVDIGDDGWSTGWREYFKPVVLKKLEVVTPWMKQTKPDRMPIVIDPGLAFGTGGHATTRLILELLEHRADVGRLPVEILDVGTGSGVLAVAAIKLGALRVTAVDIDEASVEAARKNAAANQVGDSIEVCLGTAGDLKKRWALVLSNLELSTFQKCANEIAARVENGGMVLLSGLLLDQVEECLALWPGFCLKEKKEAEGWVALALESVK